MKIEEVEKYINDTTEFVKNGQILQKVIKIDLDDLSSGSAGSDDDCSSSDQSSSRDENLGKDDGTLMSCSQMDSEIGNIRVYAESVTDYRSKHIKISSGQQSEANTGIKKPKRGNPASKS